MNLPTWKSQKHTLYKRHRYSPTLGCPNRARNTTRPSAQASQSAESKKRSTLSPRGFDGADKRPLVTKAGELSHELTNQNKPETYTYMRHRYSPTLGCPPLARNTTKPSAQASWSAESKTRSTLPPTMIMELETPVGYEGPKTHRCIWYREV